MSSHTEARDPREAAIRSAAEATAAVGMEMARLAMEQASILTEYFEKMRRLEQIIRGSI